MLEGVDASQLDEWQAYSLIHPFGHTDRLLAMILCKLVNMTRGDSPPIDIDTFVPFIQPDASNEYQLKWALAKVEAGAVKHG